MVERSSKRPDNGLKFKYEIKRECLGDRKTRQRGDRQGTVQVEEEEFADDIMAVTGSIENCKRILEIWDETFSYFGLTMSYSKTKTMTIGFDEEVAKKKSLFKIGDYEIENIRSFKYLGHTIKNTPEDSDAFIDERIKSAIGKFSELKNVLLDREIDLEIRTKLFLQGFVRSRLLYGVQAWNLNEAQKNRLEVTWHGMLRRMINQGFKRKDTKSGDDQNWAFKFSNEQLRGITKTQSIKKFIEVQQLKYTAHICRMGNDQLQKQMLFAEGNRYHRSIWPKFSKLLNIDESQVRRTMMNRGEFQKLLSRVYE